AGQIVTMGSRELYDLATGLVNAVPIVLSEAIPAAVDRETDGTAERREHQAFVELLQLGAESPPRAGGTGSALVRTPEQIQETHTVLLSKRLIGHGRSAGQGSHGLAAKRTASWGPSEQDFSFFLQKPLRKESRRPGAMGGVRYPWPYGQKQRAGPCPRPKPF